MIYHKPSSLLCLTQVQSRHRAWFNACGNHNILVSTSGVTHGCKYSTGEDLILPSARGEIAIDIKEKTVELCLKNILGNMSQKFFLAPRVL